MAIDLTKANDNPAHRIEVSYKDLMAIADIDTLKLEAFTLIAQGGVSQKNAHKFKTVVSETTTLDKLKSYLTNYMLSGSGLSVIKI